MPDLPPPDLLRHTADVVSAHLGRNKVEAELLPQLIQSVYGALSTLGGEPQEAAAARRSPAVPVRKLVFPDYIICLQDGARMKMLKRYIQKRFGLTPAAYRERWGLPSDYPMVALNYSSHRSGLAKQLGLGRKSAAEQPVEADAGTEEVEPAPEPEAEVATAAAKPRTRRKAAPAEE